MNPLVIIIFLLGTAVGSFLNVLIYRLPREEEIVKKRSHCPACQHALAWYDLIPLFSWLLLRGKCRYCGVKISWQYLAVEFTTGILFVVGFNITENLHTIVSIFSVTLTQLLHLVFVWWILSALLVIFVVDLKHYIIPDKVIAPTILVTLGYRLITVSNLTNPLLSSIGAAAFFLILVLITRGKGMGLGDVKLGAFMGLLLGFPGIIVALYTAFLTGAIVSVILLLLGRKKFGQHVPFGPFLVVGTVVAFYWGSEMWRTIWGLY